MSSEPGSTAASQERVGIFAVIVLYKMAASESSTYQTLLAALARIPDRLRMEVLLYDNTPGLPVGDLPEGVHYVASPANAGLSTAYNNAITYAERGGFSWLLTMDQDSKLPDNFLERISAIASEQQTNSQVAAIVPRLRFGKVRLSPSWFKFGVLPASHPDEFSGPSDKAMYAYNSGSLMRVAALRQIGGYSPLFWLDNSDNYVYRRFELAGKKVYIAGDVVVEHDFSLIDIKNKMSMQRYRDLLESGCAFWDLEMSWFQGIGQTARLIRLYLAHIYLKRDPEIRQITRKVIWRRLTRSKKKRIAEWLAQQNARIASYGSAKL